MNRGDFATESDTQRVRSSSSDYYMFFLAAGGIVIVLFIYGAVHTSCAGCRRRRGNAETQQAGPWVYLGPLEASAIDHAEEMVHPGDPEHASVRDLVVARARSPALSSQGSTFTHVVQGAEASSRTHTHAETMRLDELDTISPIVQYSQLTNSTTKRDKPECAMDTRGILSKWFVPHAPREEKHDNKPRVYCDVCVVCLDCLQENHEVRQLPCEHVFHSKCLAVWVTKWRAFCPLCKMSLTSQSAPRRSMRSRLLSVVFAKH